VVKVRGPDIPRGIRARGPGLNITADHYAACCVCVWGGGWKKNGSKPPELKVLLLAKKPEV